MYDYAAGENFKGKFQRHLSESTITQLCHSRILITGGHPSYSSLLPYEYYVGRSALLVNLATNSVEEKPQMTQGRYCHSVAVVGNMTYVIAGSDPSIYCNNFITSVEKYDVISERWSTLTAKFDQFTESTSSITCKSRYILTFGGQDARGKYSSSRLVRRFDHLKPMGAWVTMRLDTNKPCRI